LHDKSEKNSTTLKYTWKHCNLKSGIPVNAEENSIQGRSKVIPFHSSFSYLFRVPPENQNDEVPVSVVEDETEEEILEQEEYIRCRQCRNILASPNDRISVQGSHQHTFANPHGTVYEIGCFTAVKGCGHVGPPSDEFTWFAGYSWRVAVCFMCLTHLGWFFSSAGKESFHGLILDRLITQ
jgi:hypothetical protein